MPEPRNTDPAFPRPRRGNTKAVFLAGVAFVVAIIAFAPASALVANSSASTASFDTEQSFPGGGAYWEPAIAADPGSSYVYQAVTYINASKTCSTCPGTAIFFRASSDGGATWGPAHPISLARGRGWQFDPQIQVAADGTVYVVFLQTFDPGSVLFKSTDHGTSWSGPFTMNGALSYNDKPILVIAPSGQDVYVAFNVKLASYVAVSHDAGRTFAQVRTSNESLWWYTYGGTYAPDGSVYFAQVGEAGAKTNGKTTNQGHTDGVQKVIVLKMDHDGAAWHNVYLDASAKTTPCSISGCYGDYFAAQAAVAADSAGHLTVAYTLNAADGKPHTLFVRTSADGLSWSDRSSVNDQGDSAFPAIASGPTAGDFRLAWQDNRNAERWDCGGLGGRDESPGGCHLPPGPHDFRVSTSASHFRTSSTAPGSSSVVVSPISWPETRDRITRRMIFPLRVFGSLSVMYSPSGAAIAPISRRTCSRNSCLSESDPASPLFRTT